MPMMINRDVIREAQSRANSVVSRNLRGSTWEESVGHVETALVDITAAIDFLCQVLLDMAATQD